MNYLLFALKWLKNPYVLLALFASIYLLRTSYLKNKVTKTKYKLEIVKHELTQCQDANESNLETIEGLKTAKKELADKWTKVKNDNAQAVELIKQAKRIHDKQIRDLKAQIKPIQSCDYQLVHDDHVELLRQAAGGQNSISGS
jgi:chromosome segregation ATPase